MKDPIKISEEELKKTLDLQTQVQQIVLEFGNLYLEKLQVDNAVKVITDKETKLQEEFKNLQSQENDLIQSFFKKYGDGSLDVKRGLFLPKE